MKKTINQLAKEIHENSVSKGFHPSLHDCDDVNTESAINMGRNLNKPQHHWLLILRVMWRYSFRSKRYPSYLYNIYGSEGHSPDRHYMDNLIKQHGFWKAVQLICYNAT